MFVLVVLWALRAALAGSASDLRGPWVLLLEAGAAALVAAATCLGPREGVPPRGPWPAVSYGAWAAAVPRLIPPVWHEYVLYGAGRLSLDVLAIVLGAAVHAALALLPLTAHLLYTSAKSGETLDRGTALSVSAATLGLFLAIALAAKTWTELAG